jgi:hypothetical protein
VQKQLVLAALFATVHADVQPCVDSNTRMAAAAKSAAEANVTPYANAAGTTTGALSTAAGAWDTARYEEMAWTASLLTWNTAKDAAESTLATAVSDLASAVQAKSDAEGLVNGTSPAEGAEWNPDFAGSGAAKAHKTADTTAQATLDTVTGHYNAIKVIRQAKEQLATTAQGAWTTGRTALTASTVTSAAAKTAFYTGAVKVNKISDPDTFHALTLANQQEYMKTCDAAGVGSASAAAAWSSGTNCKTCTAGEGWNGSA